MRRFLVALFALSIASVAQAQTLFSPTIPTPLSIANGGTGTGTTSQNFAFIGPTSGSGAPSFRALTSGDLPSLSGSYCALTGCTLTGPFIASAAGAASTPGLSVTGAPYVAGNGTTNTPQLYVNAGASVTTFSTAGTVIGLNALSGFSGNLLDAHINGGASIFSVSSGGTISGNGSLTVQANVNAGTAGRFQWLSAGAITSPGPNAVQLGIADAASPSAQILRSQGVAPGTSNTPGVSLTIFPGPGTGSGAGPSLVFQTPGTGAAATVQNAEITALTIAGAVGSTPGLVTIANQLTISGTTTGTNADFLCMTSGFLVVLQASACTISSERYKDVLGGWNASDGLSSILNLRPQKFVLKDGAKNVDRNAASRQVGLIAEDVAKVDPVCAVYEQDMSTPKSYRQECIIAQLVGAVQAEQREITSLKHRIRRLEHARH